MLQSPRRPRGRALLTTRSEATTSCFAGPFLRGPNRLSTAPVTAHSTLAAETAAIRHDRQYRSTLASAPPSWTQVWIRPTRRPDPVHASDAQRRTSGARSDAAPALTAPSPATGDGRCNRSDVPVAGPRCVAAECPAGVGKSCVRPHTRADSPACTPATVPAPPLPF